MSHAMEGHPRWMGHSGEFWKNMVHWRREWQIIPVFLPGEPHEQYENSKRYDMEDEPPRLKGVQYVTGEEWRTITSNSGNNKMARPKQK